MKKLILLLVLGLVQFSHFAQTNDIVIGTIDTIESKILNEQRKLWIHVPKGSDENVFTKKTYPVVYLLDGSAHFYPTVGMIHQLSTVNGNTVCPEMIVVGITNTNRTRDLTPTKLSREENPTIPEEMISQTGGGKEFISFVENELIPYVDSNYPTEPYKVFIGHSFGGLMVMHTFFNNPALFNAYVSIDPSISYDNGKLLNEFKTIEINEKFKNRTLFMAYANTLPEGMDLDKARNDQSGMTLPIRSNIELNEHLNKNKGTFNYKGKYYPEDDHGSVPFIAGYDAIRFIFKDYKLNIGPMDFFNPTFDLAAKIEDHYKQLEKLFGYEKKPAEDYLNQMGYRFMNTKQFDKSEQLFKLNISYYPNRFNVYDSLGDLYLAKGNKEKAIENFKKALSLNPESTFTKEKLVKLEK